jgi:phage shock protein A
MGIFTRLSEILSSNLHALLDKAENPERMIGQIIREMEQGLASARQCAASAIAAERRIARELQRNRAEAQMWQARAREALHAGREDLARRALARKLEHDDLTAELDRQHLAARETAQNVRVSLRAIEARLTEARRKQRLLIARHRAAKARAELQRLAGSGVLHLDVPYDRFARLENRLTDYEEQVSAEAEVIRDLNELETEFADLAQQRRIDTEMKAMIRDQ